MYKDLNLHLKQDCVVYQKIMQSTDNRKTNRTSYCEAIIILLLK